MASEKELQIVILICLLNYMFVSACGRGNQTSAEYCSNENVYCSCQSHVFESATDCVVEGKPPDCSSWEFGGGSTSHLMTVKLGAFGNDRRVITNLTLHDVRWTMLRFRYVRLWKNNDSFCRKITTTSKHPIPELFYDCGWTRDQETGSIRLEYKAERGTDRQTGEYLFNFPSYESLVSKNDDALDPWTPFVYLEISQPVLTARWQPRDVPDMQHFEVKVCDKDVLVKRDVVEGLNGEELSYPFRQEWFPTHGHYRFKVRLLRDCANDTCVEEATGDCTNRTRGETETPSVDVGNSTKTTVIIGVVGCMVLVVLGLFILFIWKYNPLPKPRSPKLLLVYAQSTASHNRVVEKFAEYLRKYCCIGAMLDQLDIPHTETKDPYEWYNDALEAADFVLVVASPPSCCRQEGLYRDAHVIALRLLTNYLADHRFSGQCLTVVLPHCNETHLPREARSFRRFTLPRQFDSLLWLLMRDPRYPAFVNKICGMLGPAPCGGSIEFKQGGADLMEAVKQAQHDMVRTCDCSTRSRSDVTSVVPLVRTAPDVLEGSRPSNEGPDVLNVDLMQFEPLISLNQLDLTGEMRIPEQRERQGPSQVVLNLDSMIL